MSVYLLNRLDGTDELLGCNLTLNAIAKSSPGYDQSDGKIPFYSPFGGNPSDYQAVLRTVFYQNNKPKPTPGPRTFEAVISDGVNSVSASLTIFVNTPPVGGPVQTTTTITAPPITDGSPALVTVTVASPSGSRSRSALSAISSGGVPTGSVNLSISGGRAFSIGPLNSQGVVSYRFTPGGGPGDYTLEATYIPTGNFLPSIGHGDLIVKPSGKVSTSTFITVPSQITVGDTSAQAIVSVAATDRTVPTRQVSMSYTGPWSNSGVPFYHNLVNGKSAYTLDILPAGTYQLTATYYGDSHSQPSTKNTTLTVLPLISDKYYVAAAPIGNDLTGDGSRNSPWATIERVNQAIRGDPGKGKILAGDTIHFHRGAKFRGPLIFEQLGGAPGAYITITDYIQNPGEVNFPSPVINSFGFGIFIRGATSGPGFIIEPTLNRVRNDKGKQESVLHYEGKRGNFALYLVPDVWRKLDKPHNPDVEVEFKLEDGDACGLVVAERIVISVEDLKKIAVGKVRDSDKNAKIIKEEKKTVNGKEVLCVTMNAKISGAELTYYAYFYTGNEGSFQVITITGQNLFEEQKPELEAFLNGFRIIEKQNKENGS